MKRTLVVLAALATMSIFAAPLAAQTDEAGKLIAPPAIYLPAGGKVVTEINLSDDDVLGIIKQAIPAIGDVVKDLVPAAGEGAQNSLSAVGFVAMAASTIDTTGLSEAIAGVKNVRVLIAKYPGAVSPEKFLREFDKGAAKAGPFNKILSDFGFSPGAVAIYALPNNGGCMGFAYNPSAHAVYALRVVGGVDVPKLIKWAGGIAKVFSVRSAVAGQPVPAPQPSMPTPVPNAPASGGEDK